MRHRGRIEHLYINTARHHGQLSALVTELALDLRLDIAGNGDDVVRHKHPAVENALQQIAVLEPAMHRADRQDAKGFRRGKRNLRRHARAHMNNIRPLVLKNLSDAPADAGPGQRVLHPDRDRVVHRAQPVEMTDHRPATGNDHGLAASPDDGAGHLDGAALDPAAHQRRQHLHNHRPGAAPAVRLDESGVPRVSGHEASPCGRDSTG